ncbi:unnamed protein product [Macrosiphum euphorbiae]|uniref:Uncharacterized protein n=1 Tax=Macrosiphum euphorbiae TaxID=13131 RepID=A0AAV0Y4U6_9HEMI|nr:unnamed protein product [Macrosiphum euphorbiae]
MVNSITPAMHHLKTPLQSIRPDPFNSYGSLGLPWGGRMFEPHIFATHIFAGDEPGQSPARSRQASAIVVTAGVIIAALTLTFAHVTVQAKSRSRFVPTIRICSVERGRTR